MPYKNIVTQFREHIQNSTGIIHDIIRAAIATQDSELIGPARYLPMRLARLAQGVDDLDLFIRLAQLPPAPYRLISLEEPNQARAFIVDRSWRYLKEFTDWFLIHRLLSDQTPLAELDRLGRYLSAIITMFSDLLRIAVDAADHGGFSNFCGDLRNCFTMLHNLGGTSALEKEFQCLLLGWQLIIHRIPSSTVQFFC